MDIESPWITEMSRTGTCREYETYYSIEDSNQENMQCEENELEAEE